MNLDRVIVGRWRLCALLWSIVSILASPAAAQIRESPAALQITVTTQDGTVLLPGVGVRIAAMDDHTIASDVSDGQGVVRVAELAPGLYHVYATLSGFDEARASVRVNASEPAHLTLDLRLTVTEQVDVIGNAETAPPTVGEGLSTRGVIESRVVEQLPVRDHSVLSALKLLAGIVEGPGGVSIKGGRTNQSGLQIGLAALTDPSTGAPLFRLPVDAIENVEVLPNPYAVEFGRFSSGLTVINTKRGGDAWRVALNAPDISFRTVRDQPWHITGLESFGPRIGVGGPIVPNRLFLEQSAQLRYEVSEVWSRPSNETRSNKWLSAFTRLDAVLTPKHSLMGNINVFRSRADNATLSTFTGPQAAADQGDHLTTASLAAHTTASDTTVFESTLQASALTTDVSGHGTAPMQLIPQGNIGNFFNRQHRSTATLQWVEVMTASREWGGIAHLIKAGIDVMHSSFTGTSQSMPVFIRRGNLTLARLLTFRGPIRQRVDSADVAVFAQDRVQPFRRLLVEVGARVDRDGVLERVNATPRVGAVLLLNRQATAVVRGGYGLFFERTPSVIGAFDQLETTTEFRYAADGQTPAEPPHVYQHVAAAELGVPRSATWNLQYEQRLIRGFSMRTALLRRGGEHELIVNPVRTNDPARTSLVLSSAGRSRYTEGEVTLRYAPSPRIDLSGTYARSSARANLNAYTAFFDNIRWPVIDRDQYAPTASDVPHRLIAHTRTILAQRFLVSSILEIHSGFPYTPVNDMLEWVGPRNQLFRFPTVALLDLGLEHRFDFLKWKPWIGLRAYNTLNRFMPTEVQANLSSPAFGSFYNSYGRQIRLQVRFER